MNLAQHYIDDVITGKVVTNEYVKLAVNRHLDDLKHAKKRGFYFDPAAANRAIEFIKLLRHTKGEHAGTLFRLLPFQAFILWVLFGWKKKATDTRRYTKAYIELARKNTKSELGAAIALYMLIADNEKGAEIYSAATTFKQASIVFERAQIMSRFLLNDYPEEMGDELEVLQYNIKVNESFSKMEAVTAEHNKLDGKRPTCAIIDEYHAHATSKVLEVLETGMGSCTQPILAIITTAGFNREGPCFRFRKVCVDILQGVKNDDSTFAIIYCLDEGDDWHDSKTWIKANPTLGEVVRMDWMLEQYNRAINEGADKEIQFRTKNLNEWTNTYSTWISHKVWMRAGTNWDPAELLGCKCYGGLDLSLSQDLSALALYFPPNENFDTGRVLIYTWCPQDNIEERSRTDGVPYLDWARAGYITPTHGSVVDHNFIEHRIKEVAELYDLQYINYDRYRAVQLVTNLIEEGIQLHPFSQTTTHMNAPMCDLAKRIKTQTIDHGNNPLLAWCAENVVEKKDAGGNVRPDKDKSVERIDAVVALIMAIAAELQDNENNDSYYSSNDLLVI